MSWGKDFFFLFFSFWLANGMFGSMLLGLLILMALLWVCIHIYLYLVLPQILWQTNKNFFPKQVP